MSKKRSNPSDEWILRLYVAGQSARSAAALRNLEAICEEHLAGRYRIEVIDLLKHPQLARGDQIVAVPTLVRHLPPPMKKTVFTDLSTAVERSGSASSLERTESGGRWPTSVSAAASLHLACPAHGGGQL